jgi:hypothetical protein
MTTYLYGLLLDRNAHLVPSHIAGVGGGSLRVLSCEGVGALVSTVATAPRSANLDDVRAHDHALQAVVHHGATVTSVRFGQLFKNDDDLRDWVGRLDKRVVKSLEARDGCVEMRLLLLLGSELSAFGREQKTESREPVGPGTAYLEQLRAGRGTDQVKGLALRSTLGPVVLSERVDPLAGGKGAAFSHLIRRDDEPAYREAVAGQPALAGATLVGPLAFYSFADADDE